MNRCLHITIQENASALPPRAAAQLTGRAGTNPGDDNVMPRLENPGDDNVMPRLENPGDDNVMPRLENPGDDNVMPRLENPDRASYPSGGSGGYGAAVATVGPSCCTPACQGTAAPGKTMPSPFIGPRDYSGFVIVRMAEGIENDTATSLWQLAKRHEPKLGGLKAALELPRRRHEWPRHFVSRPLVEIPECARNEELCEIRRLEQTAATSPFPPRHSLTAYWRLDLRKHPGLAEKVVARLNRLSEVDLAYRELAARDSQTAEIDGKDFAEDQGYLADAPVGIGAAWVWQRRPPSATFNFNLCDLEQGWNLDHQDLQGTLARLLSGGNRADDETGAGNHGTAVLGILMATGSSTLGVKGAAAGLGSLKAASHYKAKNDGTEFAGTNGHVAEAILLALNAKELTAGDVLLLEVQRGRLPTEVDEGDLDAIRLAAGLGIIVVEAAGNGSFDLDAFSDPRTGRSLRRGSPAFLDSGAILVGSARADLPHDRKPTSNYGSRLDCFGWGEAVTTCGYGNLAGTGTRDSYTNSFSGTSSASAILAGAAALLQSLHETHTGVRLEPLTMREVLADPKTGTRQGSNVPGRIGVMPDLKAIVRDRLRLVPNIYLRRSIGDDGAPPVPGDEISSSPDIFISPGGLNTVTALFGRGSSGENLAAPGDPVVPDRDIYLRLRNRGLGDGEVHVQLFASPAATLITPERWLPVGSLDISETSQRPHAVPQGDTLVVAGPVLRGSCPIPISAPSWSLLAILSEPEKSRPQSWPYFNGMPPGPPYFDWEEYLAFLRGPGVAWRNTHRVVLTAGETTPATLTFWIAGTPDRARSFDFEVIQRLPVGAKVGITRLPAALTAKLRQRLPWLADRTGAFFLPQRPRMAIRGMEVAAGMYAKAEFTVTVPSGNPPLEAGHSLAIRQLWRGKEVGRITWYFG